MPKRHTTPRERAGARRGSASNDDAPSVQTFFRFKIFDGATRAMIQQAMGAVLPVVQSRDGPKIAQIRAAGSVDAVLDLLPLATGAAEVIWDRRLSQFGNSAIPSIAGRLSRMATVADHHIRALANEKLIANLRWRGDAGAAALREVFSQLDDYGGSLACVALGRLGDQDSTETLRTFFNRVRWNDRETFVVGPLWGLIDLGATVEAELADLLLAGQRFPELFGFLSHAGGAQAVLPLIQALLQQPKSQRYQLLVALAAIARRIGRDTLVEQLSQAMTEDSVRVDELADSLLARPADEAETYFGAMFRGPSPEDFAQSLAPPR